MKAEDLTNLGLLRSEAKVYLVLLEIGQNSAGKIAKKTKLNRNSVYKALQTLIEKGFVSYVIKANQKEFEASNPKVIQKLIFEKEKKFNEIKKQIPSLENIYKTTKKEVGTNIYEGLKGAKTIWEEVLQKSNQDDEWLILGAPRSATILGGYFKDFNKRRAKKKINIKIIYNQDAKELIKIRRKQELTEVKVMRKEYITPASIEVINDNTLIVMYEPQIIVFALKSREVANSFRQYFNLLWEISKK